MSSHDHGLPEMLDLDAEVLASTLPEVRTEIERLVHLPVRSILDLGAGTGTGTFGLLRHFPDAHVQAIDGSDHMLERLQRSAEHLGLADRVTTTLADLDTWVAYYPPFDLVWASASLHHLADPDRTLREVASTVRPDGLLAVIELSGLPRFLGDDTPGGVAEASAHALLTADRAIDMPTMGDDWGPRLTRAGLVIELNRPLEATLAPGSARMIGDYAFAVLTRIRGAVADRLEPSDREHLDELLDGGANDIRHRSDLQFTSERQLLIARRPL